MAFLVAAVLGFAFGAADQYLGDDLQPDGDPSVDGALFVHALMTWRRADGVSSTES